MSDSDFPFHGTDEFTGEVGTDCIAQPFKVNDFVLIKLATNIQWIILLSWYKMGPDICTVKFARKWLKSWKLCFPKTEDTEKIDPDDIVLKLPDPVAAGSNCRIVTDFGMDLLGYSVNWSWYLKLTAHVSAICSERSSSTALYCSNFRCACHILILSNTFGNKINAFYCVILINIFLKIVNVQGCTLRLEDAPWKKQDLTIYSKKK